MTAAESLQDQMDKVLALAEGARRLLLTGTLVDLTTLEGKIRTLCDDLLAAERDISRPLIPLMERLVQELDKLDRATRERRDAEL